ncbi:MAG: hypothetical protein U5N58_05680 [Actinomycetota bacterium]|nr:hypothetical protein [Actinomycetota bacterium]
MIKLMESLHSILNLLGYAYARQHEYTGAENYFALSVKKAPHYSQGYFNLGLSLLKQEKYEQSKKCLKRR